MAVKQANVRRVMAAYCEIEGTPSRLNRWLLADILRGEWDFDGYVISDYDGVRRMIDRQFVCATPAEAARRAISAGMDFELPSVRTNDCFQHLPELIRSGAVSEKVLDQAVTRMLRNKFLLGLFENPYHSGVAKARRVMGHSERRSLAADLICKNNTAAGKIWTSVSGKKRVAQQRPSAADPDGTNHLLVTGSVNWV
jgi:beta-glucosidase